MRGGFVVFALLLGGCCCPLFWDLPPGETTDPSQPTVGYPEQSLPDCQPFDGDERTRAAVEDWPNWGSAPELKGRVHLVALLMAGQNEWTNEMRAMVDGAMVGVCRFYEREAATYGVAPVACSAETMSLEHTHVLMPPLLADERARIDDASADAVKRATERAVREALGQTLARVSRGFRRDYDGVAFFSFSPDASGLRDWAWPGGPGWAARDAPELSLVFAQGDVLELAYTLAHEGLHLFGADDLYEIIGVGAGDEKDVMNEWCRTIGGEARVRDTTAYSVGWLEEPPARSYSVPAHRRRSARVRQDER